MMLALVVAGGWSGSQTGMTGCRTIKRS
jgi:hypothetical protein